MSEPFTYPEPMPEDEPPRDAWESTEPYAPTPPEIVERARVNDPAAEPPIDPNVDLGKLAHDVAELHDGQVILQSSLETLLISVEGLLKDPPKSKPSPFSWAHSTGAPRGLLWSQLFEWVERHNDRFGQQDSTLRIEPCWYQHPVVVEELTALMEAWNVAYIGHQVPTNEAIYYLQQFFYPCLLRIRTSTWGTTNCGGGVHKKPTATAPDETPAKDFAAFVDADVADHPAPSNANTDPTPKEER